MKKRLPVIIAIGIFALVAVMLGGMYNIQSKAIKGQEQRIAELENKISVMEKTKAEATAREFTKAVGIDMTRVENDRKICEEFMKKIMSWSSYDEYMAMRESVMSEYKIDKNSSFMTIFMPEVANKKSADGTNYNQIDTNGLNVSFESVKLYNTGISGTTYSYLAFVTWSTTDKKSGVKNDDTTIFLFDIDSDGNLKNLSAAVDKY